MHRGRIFLLGLLFACVPSFGWKCIAQEAEPTGETYHLRTYVNRIQIPTLVVGSDEKPVPGLKTDSFAIQLDSGPAFHPTHLRIQGDDPLSLSVLIDGTGSQPEIIAKLGAALADLVPTHLHVDDHVSIFAADCTMYRTRLNGKADADDIKAGVLQALHALHPPGAKSRHCGNSFRLWDFVSYMMDQMQAMSGRRIGLIVSGGSTLRGTFSPLELSRMAGSRSITLFALRDSADLARLQPNSFASGSSMRIMEDPLEVLCGSAGGMVMKIEPQDLREEMGRFITMVRGRYILEFPRPNNDDSGVHDLRVAVPNNQFLLVRAAGASYIRADPNLAKAPDVVPTAASPAVFGKRRPIIDPKH